VEALEAALALGDLDKPTSFSPPWRRFSPER
jgi:hypothetical protein